MEFCSKPETPRRIDEEGKSKRRISWGTKKVKEFENKESISESNPSSQKPFDQLSESHPKIYTIYGPEETQIISPEIDNVPIRQIGTIDGLNIDFDYCNQNYEDDYIQINSEERKKIEDEVIGDYFQNKIEDSDMVVDQPKKSTEESKVLQKDKVQNTRRQDFEVPKPEQKQNKPNKRQSIFVEKIKGRKSITKDKFDPTKRFSSNSLFKENSNYSEEIEEAEEQEQAPIIENSSNFASPIPQNINEERKIETLDDSCSKYIKEIQQNKLKEVENKQKLIRLFNSIKSPKPNKSKISEFTNAKTTNKKILQFESKEDEIELKTICKEQIDKYNKHK